MKTAKIFSTIFPMFFLFLGCNKDTSVIQNILGNKITAADKYNEVKSLANPENDIGGLILESIKSDDVEINGTSDKWIYGFTSAGIAVTYYYHATYKSVALDSISNFIKLPPTQLIIHNWINSSDAINITESNGGKDFINNNNNYKIQIKLEKPLGYNAPTNWYVTYYSKSDYTVKLSFVIDATTGKIKQ